MGLSPVVPDEKHFRTRCVTIRSIDAGGVALVSWG